MLVNPYRDRLATLPGTRILESTFDIIGAKLLDPHNQSRLWEVQCLYAPLPGRALGGFRARLTDQLGFITFCNQRDLEVLIDNACPGDYCGWNDTYYVGPTHRDWYGLCCDEDDLRDDLFEYELLLRAQFAGGALIPAFQGQLDYVRLLHLGNNNDVEEERLFIMDYDPDTGAFPDTTFENVERRWMRNGTSKVRWHT
jgi:hypothetical protein